MEVLGVGAQGFRHVLSDKVSPLPKTGEPLGLTSGSLTWCNCASANSQICTYFC